MKDHRKREQKQITTNRIKAANVTDDQCLITELPFEGMVCFYYHKAEFYVVMLYYDAGQFQKPARKPAWKLNYKLLQKGLYVPQCFSENFRKR